MGQPIHHITVSGRARRTRNSLYLYLGFSLLLGLTTVVEAKSPCPVESVQKGELVAKDLGQAQFTVMSNTSGGFQRTFQTDGRTVFKGTFNALSGMTIGEQVDVRWCVLGTDSFAARVSNAGVVPVPKGQVIDLSVPPGTEGVPVGRIYGEDSSERLGGAPGGIAFGDVNGDGYADTVVGASGRNRPASGAGAVDIIYGGPGILGSSVDLNTNGVISAHGETRILPGAGGQLLGSAVASGDVDGDGLDDVLIGSPSGHGTGQVHIVYGSELLPGTVITLNVNAAGAGDTLVLGQGLAESTGAALATGDVNADGLADVIIGAPGQTFGSAKTGGTVFILYGSDSLRGVTVDLDTNDVISAAGETRIFADSDGSAAGSSLASGDINGDGIDDVIIGAPNHNALSTTNRGSVFVVYGSAGLPSTAVTLLPTTGSTTRFSGRFANNRFGAVVASGDIDNDGFADVLVGAPDVAGVGDNFSVGEVYVFYGSASLPGDLIDVSPTTPGTHGETWITGTEEFGEFAESIASADVNGDGLDDLIMGAAGAVPFGSLPETNSLFDGALYVLLGKAGLPGNQFIDIREFADIFVLADGPDDKWGSSVAAGGDVNRDGLPEYAGSAFLGDNPSISTGNNASGYVAAIAGQGVANSTTRTRHSISGNAPPTDFGPVLRTRVDFASGTGASTDTVTITRSAPNTLPAGIGVALPVQWQVSSDRSNFTADLTFIYTDTELGSVVEAPLTVYTSADGSAGSWSVAGITVERDAPRNTITVTGLDALGHFAIVDPDSSGGAPSSDLAISMTDSPDPVGAGSSMVYSITVTNNGPNLASGVTVTDVLPAGTTFVSASPAACVNAAGSVTCNLGNIASGASTNVVLTVAANTVGTLSNTVTASADQADPLAANNTATVNTVVTAVAGELPDLTGKVANFRKKKKNGKKQLVIKLRVNNKGLSATSVTSLAKVYLSADSRVDAGTDTLLQTLNVAPLGAGEQRKFKIKRTVHGSLSGKYLILQVDKTNVITEGDETNNKSKLRLP